MNILCRIALVFKGDVILMKEYVVDLLFVIGIMLVLIPIFRFNVDTGMFVSGISLIALTRQLSRGRMGDK